MKYSNLKILARNYAPTATVEQIDDTSLSLLLQQGALDVAARTQCLTKYDYLDVDESVGNYNLSTLLPRYLGMEKAGIFWLNGTSYVEVFPRTIAWLDKNRPSWRLEEDGRPIYYCFDGEDLIVTPKPEEDTVDGLLINFFQSPPIPVNDDYYPFGGLVENTRLSPLSECILYYYKWKALGILGKSDEMDKFEPVYEREIMRKMKIINMRKDIANSEDARLMGRRIR